MLLLHGPMTLGLNFSRVWFTEGLGLSSCRHSRNPFEMASCHASLHQLCLLNIPSPLSSPKEHRLAWFAAQPPERRGHYYIVGQCVVSCLSPVYLQTSPFLVPFAPNSSPFYIPLYFCRLNTNRLSYWLLFMLSSDSYPQ